KESLGLKLKIDMAESNRQASLFNLDVYDLSNVGEGVTYRSGKVALGWAGPLSSFVGLAEKLEVKNADKIVLTPFNDTVISANYGNVIHTGGGADRIWIGSDGVAIDDLSEFDRLTFAGVIDLFGGIRNGNKETPYAYSYGGGGPLGRGCGRRAAGQPVRRPDHLHPQLGSGFRRQDLRSSA